MTGQKKKPSKIYTINLFLQVVILLLCHALITLANEKPFKEIIEVDTSLLDYSTSKKHLSRRPKRLQEPVVYQK